MKRESLVSITDFSKEEILDLLEKARRLQAAAARLCERLQAEGGVTAAL